MERKDGKDSLPQWLPQGIKKSNSTASAASKKSYNSVRMIGTHPLGTLRITGDNDDLSSLNEEEDEGPPPLDPPAGGEIERPRKESKASFSGSSSSSGRRLSHDLGGGDVLLILDLPEIFIVGYDCISFTAQNFVGVRDIPFGTHFFWVSHPNGFSTRCGVWLTTTGADSVHVVQWDKNSEYLTEPSRAEARFQRENLAENHDRLIPYRDPAPVAATGQGRLETNIEGNSQMWQQLVTFVSEDVLNRVISQRSDNWLVYTGDRVKGSIRLAAEVELDNKISNVLRQTRELNFLLAQESRTYSMSHVGAERTLEATDSTSYIHTIFQTDKALTGNDLVGELQFAYIVGMLLGNDACIQQWWHIVLKIFLRAYALVDNEPEVAAKFVRALAGQIRHSISWLDSSILDYSERYSRDFRLSLTVYKKRLDDVLLHETSPEHLDLGNAFSGLEAVVADLDWDIRGDYLRTGAVVTEEGERIELELTDLEAEDERGEYAPEVVQLDEHGRQSDLVSWND